MWVLAAAVAEALIFFNMIHWIQWKRKDFKDAGWGSEIGTLMEEGQGKERNNIR